jgi:SP family sugar:H+ symporter-like MFS transporter
MIIRYFFVPETRGLSLEQIDLLYRESSSAYLSFFMFLTLWLIALGILSFFTVIKSVSYNRRVRAENLHVASHVEDVVRTFLLKYALPQ